MKCNPILMSAGQKNEMAKRYGGILLWLTIFGVGMCLEWPSHFQRRIADFSTIERALAKYHVDHGKYPVSGGSFSTSNKWIPELVPHYLPSVPRDPRFLKMVQNKQYLYLSNGTDYKLIAHAPEDFGLVSKMNPALVDPRRASYAYGIWTPGAKEW